MPILAALLLFSLHVCPEGMRSTVPGLSTPPSPMLRVHAVTFNAGNRIYQKDDPVFDDLIAKILPGHETMGNEADIVFVGLQEFEDNGYRMANKIRTTKIWQDLTKRKLAALRQKAKEILKPPAKVFETTNTIASEIRSKNAAMESEFVQFKKNFAKSNAKFFSQLADNSPVNHLVDNADSGISTMIEHVMDRLKRYAKGKGNSERVQFDGLTVAIDGLRDIALSLPNVTEMKKELLPVRNWNRQMTKQLNTFKSELPNLNLSPDALLAWADLLKNFDNSAEERYLKQSFQRREKFLLVSNDIKKNIQEMLQQEEDAISEPLLNDWNRIAQDLETLHGHMKNLIEDGETKQKIVKAASRSARIQAANIKGAWEQWATKADSDLEKITSTPEFPFTESHIEVRMEPQKFNSGQVCQGLNHLDTVLYAFVNPWSGWKIKPVEYFSTTCDRRYPKTQKNMGCNIDNNTPKTKECGKAVNFLVFDLEHEGLEETQRICALNTHMSFAHPAEHRVHAIASAMLETRAANCTATVFMGDFNTRLHCGYRNELKSKATKDPPFARSTKTLNSFKYILKSLCKNSSPDTCSLKDADTSLQSWDEMDQILERDQVGCWEEEKHGILKHKKEWKFREVANPVRQMEFREVEKPAFPPSYKLNDPQNLQSESESRRVSSDWYRCNKHNPSESCLANGDKKPKHNPAWTDRILIKANKFVTTEYSRRMINPKFGSDHAPVVAGLSIDFSPS